ncbi:MAG: hypothetical protein EOP45_12415 [Sphingobacteriaceae bacterium]|nr:MAG: hypothetical protein EOP45_12415 [Sphingobacteriaceae bacterium]
MRSENGHECFRNDTISHEKRAKLEAELLEEEQKTPPVVKLVITAMNLTFTLLTFLGQAINKKKTKQAKSLPSPMIPKSSFKQIPLLVSSKHLNSYTTQPELWSV